jgi:hypothetical protein
MPKTSGSFKKGEAKGKPKGALNRTTKQAKELLEKVLFGQLDNVNAAFEALKKDPAKYIDAYSKMFSYVMPKKTDVTSGDEKIPVNLPNIIINAGTNSK